MCKQIERSLRSGKKWDILLIFAAVLALSLLTDITPVVPVLAAALAGILIKVAGGAKK